MYNALIISFENVFRFVGILGVIPFLFPNYLCIVGHAYGENKAIYSNVIILNKDFKKFEQR